MPRTGPAGCFWAEIGPCPAGTSLCPPVPAELRRDHCLSPVPRLSPVCPASPRCPRSPRPHQVTAPLTPHQRPRPDPRSQPLPVSSSLSRSPRPHPRSTLRQLRCPPPTPAAPRPQPVPVPRWRLTAPSSGSSPSLPSSVSRSISNTPAMTAPHRDPGGTRPAGPAPGPAPPAPPLPYVTRGTPGSPARSTPGGEVPRGTG